MEMNRKSKGWRQFPLLMLPGRAGRAALLLIPFFCSTILAGSGVTHQPSGRNSNGFTYFNDVIKSVPWSIHVVKIERSRADLEFHTTLGQGSVLGMGIVSDQAKALTNFGKPLIAINGGFYRKTKASAATPEGLQILDGELISDPTPTRTSFWIDATGSPHRSNVVSQCKIKWPDGSFTPISINGERENDTAVLYTAAVGKSTHTDAGTELVLERNGDEAWLPLQIGQQYTAKVRSVRTSGDSALERGTVILSLGSKLSPAPPKVEAGVVIKISTMTIPDLTGAKTALAGGPTLVHCGKVTSTSGFQVRHPRTAIGWNKDYFFMVEVDGRQRNLSAGMTFPELADYMLKLGCEEAVNLDGGGSATMWVLGNVMNSPSEGQERPGANALVLIQKPQPQK